MTRIARKHICGHSTRPLPVAARGELSVGSGQGAVPVNSLVNLVSSTRVDVLRLSPVLRL